MSEFERQRLVYFEVDVPFCDLRYGETTGAGTCPAVLGVDSAVKCWNTRSTCPVPLSFTEGTVTLRFGQSVAYRPREIDCIPSLISAEISPGTIRPGESLGERSTLTVALRDGQHPDTGPGYDKYRSERDYDPVAQGTYWGKFRARQPYLRGRACRIKHGYVGLPFEDFETRHFFGESFEGPTLGGTFTIVAKDIFKQLDGDRAMAPEMSNGFLVGGISAGAGSFTLSPSGIGAEYDTSGYLAIGGKEIVSFTRSGDVVTMTARGQLNTDAQAHVAQDRVQTVLQFFGENVADVIKTLMVDYAGVPSDYIPIDEWLTETESFLGTVCTAYIAEPTPVRKLVDELILQQALCVWWDDIAAQIRLTVLRSILTDAKLFDENNRAKDTPLGIREQPDKRLSQVQVYYGLINPLNPIDDTANYQSSQLTIDGEAETNNGSSAIKRVMSRWIPQNARAVAQKLCNRLLGRFRNAPRLLTFATMRDSNSDVDLGRGYNVGSQLFQGPDGARVSVPVQVIRLSPMRDRFLVEAEEMRFEQLADDVDPVGHFVIIDSDSYNINARTLHDSQYDEAESGETVTVRVSAGVTVGSTSISAAALYIGDWAVGVTVVLQVIGRIQGAGAPGGLGGGATFGNGAPGSIGGPALYTRHPINLEVPPGGELFSGAGGGGGGGGGGAGRNVGAGVGSPGAGATAGDYGTFNAGGSGGSGSVLGGGNGGAGGGPGLSGAAGANGTASNGGAGGAAGAAIDGVSYVTTTVSGGDIRGSQIN